MRYLKVHWIHNDPDEPVMLYSECDSKGWERRKVEVFPDTSVGFADKSECQGGTMLGLAPVPSIEKIAEYSEFRPYLIDKAEFERVWSKRRLAVPAATKPQPKKKKPKAPAHA